MTAPYVHWVVRTPTFHGKWRRKTLCGLWRGRHWEAQSHDQVTCNACLMRMPVTPKVPWWARVWWWFRSKFGAKNPVTLAGGLYGSKAP